MKKMILISLLIAFIPLANASLPLPPPPGSGGGIIAAMQTQENLKRQYIENQMLREQLAMMQQQRAMMKMQAEAIQQKQMRHLAPRKNHIGGYTSKEIIR